jgi:hypothetical protein
MTNDAKATAAVDPAAFGFICVQAVPALAQPHLAYDLGPAPQRIFELCGILATPAGGIIKPLAPLRRSQGKEGDMTERDLTGREDRLIGLCLAATAIIVVFIFILSTA